ncbi:hypothetical protein HAX54_021206 [Datura stramonium]|uniref:Uncharacterized protein n=1 Tax=Datura stramonium TaxID=4076 RepID=A0ABS8S3A1_DATST|nr:hypothetical protein [Datura stramonium]
MEEAGNVKKGKGCQSSKLKSTPRTFFRGSVTFTTEELLTVCHKATQLLMVKIADSELAITSEQSRKEKHGQRGTKRYMAAEAVVNQEYGPEVPKRFDNFALSVQVPIDARHPENTRSQNNSGSKLSKLMENSVNLNIGSPFGEEAIHLIGFSHTVGGLKFLIYDLVMDLICSVLEFLRNVPDSVDTINNDHRVNFKMKFLCHRRLRIAYLILDFPLFRK